MNTETAIVEAGQSAVVPLEGDHLELSATTADEMEQCASAMIQWAKRKVVAVRGEAAELRAAFDEAVARKWKSSVLKKHADYATKRLTFYEKILAALEAGYHIVPNFPAETFAIRTKTKNPSTHVYAVHYEPRMTQEAQALPEGAGEWRNPEPTFYRSEYPKKDGESQKYTYHADSWDELEFPAHMSRVRVMQATDRAMALKIFDEIKMLPSDRKRHSDPVILATILGPRKHPGYARPTISFMVAWHIDTRTL